MPLDRRDTRGLQEQLSREEDSGQDRREGADQASEPNGAALQVEGPLLRGARHAAVGLHRDVRDGK